MKFKVDFKDAYLLSLLYNNDSIIISLENDPYSFDYGLPADCFPNRKIVTVNIDAIAIGGGGIHCVTQQKPKTATQSIVVLHHNDNWLNQ
ncbi:MAG: agmatine deiminase family protein [Arsenophonus endosymbiont of Dermacentor nuttalli]